jgi:hypothetical protein
MFFAIVFQGNSRAVGFAKGRRYAIYGAHKRRVIAMQDVSPAVKLHQVKVRARKNCIRCT